MRAIALEASERYTDRNGRRVMSIFKPVTVVTGASGGIGEALARVFARNGHEVALVARREKEMIRSRPKLLAVSCKYKPHVITADLQRSDAPARIAHELLGRGLEPAIVVNNAGFGLHGEAAHLDRAEQLAMIVSIDARTLTDLSLRWIDGIVRHRGGILNVASVAVSSRAPEWRSTTPQRGMCCPSPRGSRANSSRKAYA